MEFENISWWSIPVLFYNDQICVWNDYQLGDVIEVYYCLQNSATLVGSKIFIVAEQQ